MAVIAVWTGLDFFPDSKSGMHAMILAMAVELSPKTE
jgi:hypothetical protein